MWRHGNKPSPAGASCVSEHPLFLGLPLPAKNVKTTLHSRAVRKQAAGGVAAGGVAPSESRPIPALGEPRFTAGVALRLLSWMRTRLETTSNHF